MASQSAYRDFGTPAVVVSQFFLGKTPSEAKFNALLVEAEKQFDAYTARGVLDPVLGAYEAFGRGFAEAYPTQVSGTTTLDFITSSYASIFGTTISAQTYTHFDAQLAAMKALYIANGAAEADATVSARGAVIGQMLGEAVKVGGNAYADGAARFLADSLDGKIEYEKGLDTYKPDTVVVEKIVVVEKPVPGPVVDKPDATVKVYGDLDAQFTANGKLLFGDQTTPATGQNTVYDPVSGAIVSLSMMPRQTVDGTQYRPASAEFDGVTLKVAFNIPAGQQLLANGSFQDVANRGAGSTNFTVGADGGIKEFLQAGNKVELKIDQDKTAGEAHFVMNAVIAADGTIDFTRADGGPGGLLDNTGNTKAFANSTQQNFFLAGGVADLTDGSIFSNELNVYDAAGAKIIGITEVITLVGFNYAPADQLS